MNLHLQGEHIPMEHLQGDTQIRVFFLIANNKLN